MIRLQEVSRLVGASVANVGRELFGREKRFLYCPDEKNSR
jgi:hypothetical protein